VDIVKNIAIPKFNEDNKLHMKVAKLSSEAHIDYNDDKKKIPDIEKSLDALIPNVFGIN